MRAEQKVIRLGVNNLGQPAPKAFTQNNLLNIASCSGIHRLKRLDLIIDSLAEVSDAIKLNWVHFGDGSDYNLILDYAKKKLVKNNIAFTFKGQLSNSDILKYYQDNHVDIFINTSDYEGIPVSIMEAMSFGIPCIARNVGGNSEIVVNQISGKLIPKEATSNLIADVIENFYFLKINDVQNYQALRFSTYNYWKDNFNAIDNYNVFLDYIINRKLSCVR